MEKAKNFFSRNYKKIIIIASAAVVLIFAAVMIFLAVKGFSAANKRITVYKKDGKCVVRINDKEKIIADPAAADFKCDEENKRVYFLAGSAKSQELYDLYYVEIKKGEIIEPRLIDYGIEKEYYVASGNVYYLKFNSQNNTDDGCICSISDNKIETFSQNVKSVIALENSNEIYFTKMHSDTKVLYRYSNGTPTELCRDVTVVQGFNNGDKPHIIYEKPSAVNDSLRELYIAYSGSEPELICDSANKVMLDEYKAGGNLYYFTSASESISWSYVIADAYEETDKTITKPKRTDFFSFFGISTEYNEKLRAYQDKLVRDEIREALNETMEAGTFNAPVFTVYAYNSEGTFKVAENVDPGRVYTVSSFGEPKLVYESTNIFPSTTDMTELVAIAQKSTMDEVIDFAKSVVNNSIKSNGMALAACGESGCVSYPLTEYNNTKTVFSFSTEGDRLYALVKGAQAGRLSLYTNVLDAAQKPSDGVSVDTDVSAYKLNEDSIIYFKSDTGRGTGDVFSYNGKENTKLSNNAGTFTLDNDKNIIILKNYCDENDAPTVDLYTYKDGEEQLIGECVAESGYDFDKNGNAAFIRCGENGERKLCISCSGKVTEIADSVSEILLFE